MLQLMISFTAKVSMKYMTYCPSCDSIDLTPLMQVFVDLNIYGAAYFLM